MLVREFLDRMGYTVCEPLPFESLKDILRTRVRSRAPHGCCLLSQWGNKQYTLFPSKGTMMLSRSDHKSGGFSHNGHTNCGKDVLNSQHRAREQTRGRSSLHTGVAKTRAATLRLGFGAILPAGEHVRSRPHALKDIDRCGLRDDVRLAAVLDEVRDKAYAGQRCATPVKVKHAPL